MSLHRLEIHPDFRHLPLHERREAAHHAQRLALHHWQVWLTILFLIVSVVALSLLDTTFRLSDQNGTAGAFLGFLLGTVTLNRAIYRFGLPYYRQALQQPKSER